MTLFKNIIGPAVRICILSAGLLLSALTVHADRHNAPSDSITEISRESFFPEKSRSLAFSHFTWGAEAGASIDMSGYDLSTVDVDVLFGYKNSFFRMLGVGVGIHRTIQRGDNFIPIYATVQTSFRNKPSLFFFSAKIGYSFNSIEDSPTFGDTMSQLGVGINLSASRRAKSYIIASAGYRYFTQRHIDQLPSIDRHYIFIAQLSIGVSF